ncbi:MAG: hypothetical protein ACYCPW_02620 [Nitrososphaerales archaeon]
MKIGEALPDIFRRTYPVLEPGTQMLLAASLLRFHQIDALPIGFKPRQKRRKRLAVFGYSCLSKLLETDARNYGKFLEMPCEHAALALSTIDVNEIVEALLRVFEKTKFGFAWVESERLGGFASLRDVLELYAKGVINAKMTVGEVASPIFSLPKDSKIKSVLQEMFNHRIRRVFVSGERNLVTDRMIISYIFSVSRLAETTKKPEKLLDAKLGDLDKMEPVPINGRTSLREAAAALSKRDATKDCLFCDEGVVTPWDLVIKPFIYGKLTIKRSFGH